MIWAAMSSAGVWSTVFSEVHSQAQPSTRDILEHFMLPSADKLYGDADFIFQQDLHLPTLPKVPKTGSMTMVLLCLIDQQTHLTWAHREYKAYCQEEDERHQTQQCRWPEGCYQSILGFITPEQCHRLITFMPRRIDAVIHAKRAQPSIECIEMKHTFQKPDISV